MHSYPTKRRNKNDLRVYSQSMLGDGWMDRGISVVDIGEKQLEHLSARRPWRVSMQRKMLEVVDLVVGAQERERVNREGFIKRQWDNTLDQEILEKDRMCLKKVAESLKGLPVAEVALQYNLLVIEPNVPDSKPHA